MSFLTSSFDAVGCRSINLGELLKSTGKPRIQYNCSHRWCAVCWWDDQAGNFRGTAINENAQSISAAREVIQILGESKFIWDTVRDTERLSITIPKFEEGVVLPYPWQSQHACFIRVHLFWLWAGARLQVRQETSYGATDKIWTAVKKHEQYLQVSADLPTLRRVSEIMQMQLCGCKRWSKLSI